MGLKSLKKSIFASVVAIIVFVFMLIGTTFAWFSDVVSSDKNTIQAGNLKVKFEYSADMTTWTEMTDTSNVFKENALWEPGFAEVVYLRISNVGSLDIKYQLGLEVLSELDSVNVYNEYFALSDNIVFDVVENVSEKFDSRDLAVSAATNAQKIKNGYEKEFTINAGDDSQTVALVVYMPQDLGNEVNYKEGYNAPQITLGISVVATQLVSENDAFDNTYDTDAFYPVTSLKYTQWKFNALLTDYSFIGSYDYENQEWDRYPDGCSISDGTITYNISGISTMDITAGDTTIKVLSTVNGADEETIFAYCPSVPSLGLTEGWHKVNGQLLNQFMNGQIDLPDFIQTEGAIISTDIPPTVTFLDQTNDVIEDQRLISWMYENATMLSNGIN